MVIEWREREHEGVDNEALNHPDMVNAFETMWVAQVLSEIIHEIRDLIVTAANWVLGSR